MSERVDLIPVAMWSAWVAFQASAIYAWWTKPRIDGSEEAVALQKILERERQLFNSGWIRSGGKIDVGWKRFNFASIDESSWQPTYKLLPPLWPKNGSEAEVDMSVLMSVRYDVDGNDYENRQVIYFIRRYSLIAPGVHDDIFRCITDDWWGMPSFQGYISENVVAIGWNGGSENRIVLVEVKSKRCQYLEMPKRGNICTIFKDSIGGRLMILYDGVGSDFYLVDYEISPSESFRSPIVQEVASRRLPWLEDPWFFNKRIGPDRSLYFPGVFYRMRTPFLDPSSLRVISFDRYGFHDLGDEFEWIAKFKRTRLGLRMTEMKRSLHESLPIISIDGFELHRSHLFARIDEGSVYVHRPLSPPSLKYIAAEAFCMANPGFDFADLKNRIGFDIFDGISDKKKPAVINIWNYYSE